MKCYWFCNIMLVHFIYLQSITGKNMILQICTFKEDSDANGLIQELFLLNIRFAHGHIKYEAVGPKGNILSIQTLKNNK